MTARAARAAALAFAAAVALAGGCSRNKDPYADFKAPQMLEEGDRLLRAGDLAAAETVFRRGLERAQKDGYTADKTRVFIERMTLLAAARGSAADTEKLLARTGALEDPDSMDITLAIDLVLLHVREGKPEKARALAEKLARRLAVRPPNPEELPVYVIGWIAIDRLRTQNVELTRAREATRALVETLKSWVEWGRPMPAGPRAWIGRYVDHLFDSERSLIAQEIGDLMERIDERAPPPEDRSPCVPLDANFSSLGCLPDWPK